jgi:two-component system response regulator HydG
MEEKENKKSILVVEDDSVNLESVCLILSHENFNIMKAASAEIAIDIINKEKPDVILTDLVMPKMDGMELLRVAKELCPLAQIILMTAHGTIEVAVDAMKYGAYDFITKPFKKMELLKVVNQAIAKQNLIIENNNLKNKISNLVKEKKIIGISIQIKKLYELIEQVSSSDATVLITGESGVGKELVCDAIHTLSPRKKENLVKLSCASIPETLLESELFGHEKGAFTGAIQSKIGKFELANNGTIFLDEIADIPLSIQVKLLRVIENGEFTRLGSNKLIKVNARIIAATNKNLETSVREKTFRDDLYYRLNVIRIHVPPLRERMEDISLLAYHFLKKYNEKNNKNVHEITQECLTILCNYSWPGNVRELENVLEQATVLTQENFIDKKMLPSFLINREKANYITIPMGMKLEDIEDKIITETLKFTNNDKILASKLLGIAERTIYRKLDSKKQNP